MADKYDELLKQGLRKLKEIEFSDIPREEDMDHSFSDKYLKHKEKLLKKLNYSYWKYVNTVAKKVAIVTISFIIAFSSLMTVDAFRESIMDFIVTVYETFSKIEQYSKDSCISTYYSLQTLPSGYNKKIIHSTSAVHMQVWTNHDSKNISINQVPFHIPNSFNTEHGELSEAIINNTPSLVCKDQIQYYCYWEFDGYRFELIYPVELGEEFMSEVVGHLVEVNPEDFTTE